MSSNAEYCLECRMLKYCTKRFFYDDCPLKEQIFRRKKEAQLSICEKRVIELEKENEQLKQFKDNVFDLIDKNIKEIKELFEDGKIDLISYNGAMITLIGLKEELKGDVE